MNEKYELTGSIKQYVIIIFLNDSMSANQHLSIKLAAHYKKYQEVKH